jgi:prepilin-type N-terminal cleavage/methylation domain-containing protein
MKVSSFKNLVHKNKGFTLVEMLVVLGLFSFIMTLATSVLYSTQAVNVKLQETQAVLDNVNVSIETMVRDIRYGSVFHCMDTLPDVSGDSSYLARRNCAYGGTEFSHGGHVLFFKPVEASNPNDRVAYYATTTKTGMVIQKNEYASGVLKATYQVTSDDVKVSNLIFYLTGASSTVPTKDGVGDDIPGSEDYIQPLVTLTVAGETIPIKEGASSTKFLVETSISSRILDN